MAYIWKKRLESQTFPLKRPSLNTSSTDQEKMMLSKSSFPSFICFLAILNSIILDHNKLRIISIWLSISLSIYIYCLWLVCLGLVHKEVEQRQSFSKEGSHRPIVIIVPWNFNQILWKRATWHIKEKEYFIWSLRYRSINAHQCIILAKSHVVRSLLMEPTYRPFPIPVAINSKPCMAVHAMHANVRKIRELKPPYPKLINHSLGVGDSCIPTRPCMHACMHAE